MHRVMMNSSTYRMSSQADPVVAKVDPENKLLSHMNRKRLEAEAIRDALLQVSGVIDFEMAGTQLTTKNRAYVTSTANVNPKVYGGYRRSVYLPVVRSAVYEVLQAFDFPDPAVINGTRQSTTVAPQALFMMNSKLVAELSSAFAKRIGSRDNLSEQIEKAYQLAFLRKPSAAENAWSLEFLMRYAKHAKDAGHLKHAKDANQAALEAFCRTLFAANEFIFVE